MSEDVQADPGLDGTMADSARLPGPSGNCVELVLQPDVCEQNLVRGKAVDWQDGWREGGAHKDEELGGEASDAVCPLPLPCVDGNNEEQNHRGRGLDANDRLPHREINSVGPRWTPPKPLKVENLMFTAPSAGTPATFDAMRMRRISAPAMFDAESASICSVTPGSMLADTPSWESWQDFAFMDSLASPAFLDGEETSRDKLMTLTPYLSRLLLQKAIKELDTVARQPSMDGFTAAVLIADITGFTPLTERALTSKRGTELVEELTVCMNNYFDEAIQLILDYGGDITKFAGDSMIVCFPVDIASNESQASCGLRAAACGFDLVSTLGAYTPQLGGYGNTSNENENEGVKVKRESSEFVRVMVVDHVMLNGVGLSKMLSKLNCEVVLARNGTEAVATHCKQAFHLIFMDVNMPIMDGFEATRRVRQSPVGLGRRPTYIIGVCAHYDDELRKSCIASGMDELLAKPVTMSQLVTILRMLRTHQNRQEWTDEVAKPTSRKQSPQQGTPMRKVAFQGLSEPSLALPLEAPFTLTLKVMIGMGEVCTLSVGGGVQVPTGQPRWEFFMADMPFLPGPDAQNQHNPIDQLCHCEDHAKSGDVILSPEIWAHINQECVGEVLKEGFVRLSHVVGHVTVPLSQKSGTKIEGKLAPKLVLALKRYLPEVLHSQMVSNPRRSGIRAEVRYVTCVFVGFPSLSIYVGDSSLHLQRVQTAMLAVQQSLRLYEGALAQFRMDEKGYLLICAFGLPGNLHEDDPKRAIQTALTIQESLKNKGQGSAIGVTTGKLLCTLVGGKKRCEYTVFGDPINLSARLMKKAKNEILTDMETYVATSTLFDYVALPPMTVKGKKGPINVYRALSQKISSNTLALSQPLPPRQDFPESVLKDDMIGRKEEFETFIQHIDEFLVHFSSSSSNAAVDTRVVKTEFDVTWETAEIDKPRDGQGSGGAAEAGSQLGRGLPVLEPSGFPAQQKPCTAIMVIGHAGIGKSKLLQSVLSRLKQQARAQVLLTASDPEQNNTLVFGPWVRVIRDLFCFDPRSSPEERGLLVLQNLPVSSIRHAHLLKDILKIKFKQPSHTRRSRIPSVNTGKNFKRLESDPPIRSRDSFEHKEAVPRHISSFLQLAAQGATLISSISPQRKSPLKVSEIMKSSKASSMTSAPDPSARNEAELAVQLGSTTEPIVQELEERIGSVSLDNHGERPHSTEDFSSKDRQGDSRRNLTESWKQKEETKKVSDSKRASADVRVQRIGRLIQELLLSLVSKPCIIFVEDAHLLDKPSWGVLKGVTNKHERGILVVAACRPFGCHAPKEYTALIQTDSTLMIHLRELSEIATQELVRQKIRFSLQASTEIPDKILEAIFVRTHGHPLFAEQMASALIDMNINSKSMLEACEASSNCIFDLDKFSFSHSMDALVTSRIDLLEPAQALILKVASVMGLKFSVDPLLVVVNQQLHRDNTTRMSKQQLQAGLQNLDKLNFLTHWPTDPEGFYSFSNLVIRDVAYEVLPFKQRRSIHADLAKELLSKGTSGMRCVSVAHHCTMACKDVEEIEIGLAAIAIDHWEKAASTSLLEFGQYETAIHYYQNAISLGTIVRDHINPMRVATWHQYLARAYVAIGNIESGWQHTILALKIIGESLPADPLPRWYSGFWCSNCGLGLFLRESVHQVIMLWRKGYVSVCGEHGPEKAFRCEALIQLASLAILKEDLQVARVIGRRCLSVAEKAGKELFLEVARAHSLLALVADNTWRAKQHMRVCLQLLAHQVESLHIPVQAGDIHYNLASVYLLHGQWSKAASHAAQAIRVYEASHGQKEMDLCHCLKAIGHLYQGDFEACHVEGFRLLAARKDHPQLRVWALFLMIASLSGMGHYQEAVDNLAQLDTSHCSIPSMALQVRAVGWEASLHIQLREKVIQEATMLLPQLINITPLTPVFPMALASAIELFLLSVGTQTLLDPPNRERERVVELLLDRLKLVSARIEIGWVYYKLFKARLAFARGNVKVASVEFKAAAVSACEFGMMHVEKAANLWTEQCTRATQLNVPYERLS